ncbi:MAG: hypothetical protein ABJF10_23790 [Chthoniobacter sp.]|uniref:hypothetical protein n=1 Tax=Chthoniobacter sp. TaxID=2510640 RepID=UPI0032AA2589
MKSTIYKKVSRAKLARILPEAFDAQLPRSITEPVTATVFRDEVVTGRIARKAVERIGTDFGASLVFAARDFTCEATDLATAHGAIVIPANGSWGGYFWSDERLADIRTSIATHRPLDAPPATELTSNATGNP